jgi:hypothetical protein
MRGRGRRQAFRRRPAAGGEVRPRPRAAGRRAAGARRRSKWSCSGLDWTSLVPCSVKLPAGRAWAGRPHLTPAASTLTVPVSRWRSGGAQGRDAATRRAHLRTASDRRVLINPPDRRNPVKDDELASSLLDALRRIRPGQLARDQGAVDAARGRRRGVGDRYWPRSRAAGIFRAWSRWQTVIRRGAGRTGCRRCHDLAA